MHMLKDLPERNTLLPRSQQQTNNYSQEIAHERNTFERRIYDCRIPGPGVGVFEEQAGTKVGSDQLGPDRIA